MSVAAAFGRKIKTSPAKTWLLSDERQKRDGHLRRKIETIAKPDPLIFYRRARPKNTAACHGNSRF